jgi:hypothetical protein
LIRPKLLTASSGGGDIYIGEQEFLGVGVFAWDVPLSVRYLHACAIGAGGPYGSQTIDGGGGGGLAWANDIEVTPGETLIIQVGRIAADDSRDSGIFRLADPEDIDSAKTWLIKGEGGNGYYGGGFSFGSAGSMGSRGGGRGGNGSLGSYSMANGSTVGSFQGSGGGAGGYTGNGGGESGGAPAANSGGASAGTEYWQSSGSKTGKTPGGAGGGVGVRGRGATASGITQPEGAPTVNGNPGSGGSGARYGGGDTWPGGRGGDGAVRIIWGIKYRYPDNADVEAVE